MAVLILSSHSDPRQPAPVNHQCYAARHGYGYLFDATPDHLASPCDQKLRAVSNALGLLRDDDVLVWIDDDAYTMQLDRRQPSGLFGRHPEPTEPPAEGAPEGPQPEAAEPEMDQHASTLRRGLGRAKRALLERLTPIEDPDRR